MKYGYQIVNTGIYDSLVLDCLIANTVVINILGYKGVFEGICTIKNSFLLI